MKKIGNLENGNVLVEMTPADQMAMVEAARMLTVAACVPVLDGVPEMTERVEKPRCADAPQREGAGNRKTRFAKCRGPLPRPADGEPDAEGRKALSTHMREEKERGEKPRGVDRLCEVCKRVFVPERKDSKCCSEKCKKEASRKYMREWHTKHRAVKTGKKAAVAVTATEPPVGKEAPSAVVMTPGARMAAIRAADERVRERLATKGGGL